MHNVVDILVLPKWQNSPSMGLGVTSWGWLPTTQFPFPFRKSSSGPVVSKTSSYRAWPTISAAVLGKAWLDETQDALQVWKLTNQWWFSLTFWRVLVANFLGLLSIDVWKFLHLPQDAILTCHVMSLKFRKRNGPWSQQKGYLKVMAAFFETTNDGRDPAPTEMYRTLHGRFSWNPLVIAGFLNHQQYDVLKKPIKGVKLDEINLPNTCYSFLGEGNQLVNNDSGHPCVFRNSLEAQRANKTPFWTGEAKLMGGWALAWYEESWLI